MSVGRSIIGDLENSIFNVKQMRVMLTMRLINNIYSYREMFLIWWLFLTWFLTNWWGMVNNYWHHNFRSAPGKRPAWRPDDSLQFCMTGQIMSAIIRVINDHTNTKVLYNYASLEIWLISLQNQITLWYLRGWSDNFLMKNYCLILINSNIFYYNK